MKFVISKTSAWGEKPTKNAILEELTYKDFRTVKLKQVQKHTWGATWLIGGTNHREERGMAVRNIKKEAYTIEIKDLKELIKFQEKHGEIILKYSGFIEIPDEIEIYDNYRE
jgi:hypothetical protein